MRSAGRSGEGAWAIGMGMGMESAIQDKLYHHFDLVQYNTRVQGVCTVKLKENPNSQNSSPIKPLKEVCLPQVLCRCSWAHTCCCSSFWADVDSTGCLGARKCQGLGSSRMISNSKLKEARYIYTSSTLTGR